MMFTVPGLVRAVLETQREGGIPIRVRSDGNSLQPILRLRNWRRSQEPRGSGATEVLDRKNSGNRRGGEREAEPGPDS